MARKTLAPGTPAAYLAKLVPTKWESTFLIVPIDSDLEVGGGPIIPPEGPGGPGGPGGGGPEPVEVAGLYSPPEGTTPPVDPPLAANYEWMIALYPDRSSSWAQVGPHMQPTKK